MVPGWVGLLYVLLMILVLMWIAVSCLNVVYDKWIEPWLLWHAGHKRHGLTREQSDELVHLYQIGALDLYNETLLMMIKEND